MCVTLRRYAGKALSADGLAKVVRDPAAIGRAVRTLATNRNLRTISPTELLRDAEASVQALARIIRNEPCELAITSSLDVTALGELFRNHGSDKSTDHDYFEVYGSILSGKRNEPLRILEVGLGTNNLAFQSNMGLGGRPGASLRAFRDWAPRAQVFGADIDRGVLFTEDRIKTFFVDQCDPTSLKSLTSEVGNNFDLIIDDGLHLPHANFNTIEALLPLLKSDGTMVVEDIDAVHLDYWRIAQAVLSDYETILTERRGGWIFIVKSRGR
jgi:SAM-dependent methyltransferase